MDLEKKAAAAEEDFELAMNLKKQITEVQGTLAQMKNDLMTAVVLGNSGTQITDKEILLGMVDLEDQFRKGSSSYVSHAISLY